MLPFYLFALIVGGGLLAFSLLLGGGETETDASLSDAELDTPMAVDHDGAGGDWMVLQSVLSLRTLIYLLAGFGATGTLLEILTDAGPTVSLLWAVVTGLAAAATATAVYGWVRGSDSGEVSQDPDYLVGVTARVLLPVVQGHRGKIVAIQGGREVELLARLFGPEDESCPRGSEVVIVDVDGETALVAPLPRLSSESAQE